MYFYYVILLFETGNPFVLMVGALGFHILLSEQSKQISSGPQNLKASSSNRNVKCFYFIVCHFSNAGEHNQWGQQ